MGGVALLLAGVIAFIYVIMGGFHYSAFIRRERVVMQLVKVYQKFAEEIDDSQRKMAEKLWETSIDEKIDKVLAGLKVEGMTVSEKIGEILKNFAFFILSIICIVVVTLFVFAVFLAQVFFKTLIIWKQSKTFVPVLEYHAVIARIIAKITTTLAGFPGIEFLKFLLSLLGVIFDFLAEFKIDISAMGVSCVGAGAPFQLLLDLAVLGIVILVVESELQTFRGLCFQLTLERFSAKLLSREYRLKCLEDRTDFLAIVNFYVWYVLRLLGLLFIQG